MSVPVGATHTHQHRAERAERAERAKLVGWGTAKHGKLGLKLRQHDPV